MKKLFFAAVAGLVLGTSCTTIEPVTATDNPIGNKVGTSSNNCVFSLGRMVTAGGEGFQQIGNGMCFSSTYGLKEAVDNGGINKVATVDLKSTWYVFFTKYELIVTGE